MLDTQLYDCNVSSWATDKAVDPTFQLRGFFLFFPSFLQHGTSRSLASVTVNTKTKLVFLQFFLGHKK